MIPGIVAGSPVAGGAGVVDLPHAYTVLLIEGQGDVGSTTVVDESAHLHGLGTPNGNVAISTSSPAPSVGAGTIAFDGAGDWLEWADHADWTLGNNDLTLAGICSFKAAGLALAQTIASHYNATAALRGWVLQYDGATTGNLTFFGSVDGTTSGGLTLSGAFSPTADVPYFFLVTRSGNAWRMHIGPVSAGVAPLVASATSSISIYDTATALMVGRTGNTSGDAQYLNGNINTLALAVGYAWQASDADAEIPTASFPRGTYTDPLWPWVAFLSGFEEANGTTVFHDEGPQAKAITTVGNAQATTASPLVGTASLLLDGSGDYLTLPNSADLSVSPGDVTIEARIKSTSLAHINAILSKRSTSPVWQMQVATTGVLSFTAWNSSGVVAISLSSAAGAIAINTEYKVAAVRKANNYYLFIDGTLVASGAQTSAPTLGNTTLSIGRDAAVAGREFQGTIDEVRITRSALYTANYVPTAGAFTRG